MKKTTIRIIVGIEIAIALLAVIAIIRAVVLNNIGKVEFKDDIMEIKIAKSAWGKSAGDFRVEDLDKVKSLDIRYTGFYDTLIDIEKCKNLERLKIGQIECTEKQIPENKERIRQIEEELRGILKECQQIDSLFIIGTEHYFQLNDLEFLKNGKKLEDLSLFYQPALDYSAISEVPQLKSLIFVGCELGKMDMLSELKELESLWIKECDVTEAGEIVQLETLAELRIEDTPLAGNGAAIEAISENCPNIKSLILTWEEGGLDSLEFLKNEKNLEELILTNQSSLDYSIISECTKLRNLSLNGCDISDLSMLCELEKLESLGLSGTKVSEARDILKLKNLKSLYIKNTPLAENEEQLALIYQQFPDIEIDR